MGAAVATVSITDNRFQWVSGFKYFVLGNITISASPATYSTGGIACNLFNPEIKATRTPIYVEVIGQSGYVYRYIPGADASTGKLKIFVQDATAGNPLAEIAGGTAIPAGASGDTIQLYAIFHGME